MSLHTMSARNDPTSVSTDSGSSSSCRAAPKPVEIVRLGEPRREVPRLARPDRSQVDAVKVGERA